MKVVYAFCESDGVRIPFFDYDKELFLALKKHSGGVWNNFRKEFIFPVFMAEQFYRNFPLVPWVQVTKYDSVSVRIFGFLKYPCELTQRNYCKQEFAVQKADFDLCAGLPEKTEEVVMKPAGLSGKSTAFATCQSQPDSIFSLPPVQADMFPEHWRERLELELRARKYSPHTRRSYLYYNRLFCQNMEKQPEAISDDDLTLFLAAAERDRDFSASAINLAISAIKFFYRNVMKKSSLEEHHRPSQDRHLPQVLSKDEVHKILSMEKNPKHRLLLMLVYSSGLRVSEAVSLKKEHIDLSRKVIYVKLGKGRKDRCTLLSEKAARFIAEYTSFYGIQSWIFPGQTSGKHLSIRSAQNIFDKSLRNAGIQKDISIHGLRHTFATHLLESGTDIRYIQSLLGHASLRTTERYTHIARRNILNIQSPLDTI